mgnify:FL=1
MNAPVTSMIQPDYTFGQLCAHLAPHTALPLVLTYAGRTIQPGYHVTEVKAAHFAALDCGGNPDKWSETVLQVEDLPAREGNDTMSVGKFLAILARVEKTLSMDQSSRVTIEISRPGEAMQVFDIARVEAGQDRMTLELEMRPAICKPRHRASQPEAACCGPTAQSAACCA